MRDVRSLLCPLLGKRWWDSRMSRQQFNTLNQPLCRKGVQDDGCAERGWSHTCSSLVSGVLPRSLCKGGCRLVSPRGWLQPGDVEAPFLEEP